MYPNANSLVESLREVVEDLRELTRNIFQALDPPPGLYSLFHHHGHMIERVEDVIRIIERIGTARVRLNELEEEWLRLQPEGGFEPGVPYPESVQKITRENSHLTQLTRMDAESLYIFANMALDQWAYTIAYCLGLDRPETYTFHILVEKMQAEHPPESLRPLVDGHFSDAIWLYYQLRFYRNNFIEHVRRPWQRGSTMTIGGSDFNFSTPSPPGWVPAERAKKLIEAVRPLAPRWLQELPDDNWQKARPAALLAATYKEIDRIPRRADRETVWRAWKELGGSVVSFDELGRRLAHFLGTSCATLAQRIESSPDQINFGPPPSE